MSKDNVFDFFADVVNDDELKAKVKETSTPEDLKQLGHKAGYSFSTAHVQAALRRMTEHPGMLGDLADAIIDLFGPIKDNYPATGVQPFSGDPNSKH